METTLVFLNLHILTDSWVVKLVPGMHEQKTAKQEGRPPIVLCNVDEDGECDINSCLLVLFQLDGVVLGVWRLKATGNPESPLLVWEVGGSCQLVALDDPGTGRQDGDPVKILPGDVTIHPDTWEIAYVPCGRPVSLIEAAALDLFAYVATDTLDKCANHYGISLTTTMLKGRKAALLIRAMGPGWGWSDDEINGACLKVDKVRTVVPKPKAKNKRALAKSAPPDTSDAKRPRVADPLLHPRWFATG